MTLVYPGARGILTPFKSRKISFIVQQLMERYIVDNIADMWILWGQFNEDIRQRQGTTQAKQRLQRIATSSHLTE
jgi:hypothetical protein